MIEKNKLTSLLGAGATLDVGGPSTLEITAAIKNSKVIIDKDFQQFYVKTISDLHKYYGELFNFEVQIYKLEEILHYFTKIKFDLLKEFKEKSHDKEFLKQFSRLGIIELEFNGILKAIIEAILRFVYIKTKLFNPYEPKNLFLTSFLKKLTNECILEIGTLNYDYLIEKTMTPDFFEDGFVSDSGIEYFSAKKLFEADKSRILHLHGAFDYYEPNSKTHLNYDLKRDGLFKREICSEEEIKVTYRSEASIIGSMRVLSPIITGFEKIKKVSIAPLNEYFVAFSNQLFNTSRLLIAGYAFNDDYINDLLNRFTKIHGSSRRIVIIDYFNPKKLKKTILEDVWNQSALKTIKYLIDDEVNYTEYSDYQKPFISSDGCVRIYLLGMRDTLINFGDEIIAFLNS